MKNKETILVVKNIPVTFRKVFPDTASYDIFFTKENIYFINKDDSAQWEAGFHQLPSFLRNPLVDMVTRKQQQRKILNQGKSLDQIIEEDRSAKKIHYSEIKEYILKPKKTWRHGKLKFKTQNYNCSININESYGDNEEQIEKIFNTIYQIPKKL